MENSIVKQLTEKTEALIADSALFLVELTVSPANNIKIFIDGDAGVTIEAVSKINRALYRQLEEEEFLNGDFSLEVSSPGVDEPLKFLRQYNKNIGRKVEVTLNEGEPVEGKLMAATETEITIEETIGKKKEIKETVIPFSNIKKTVVQISF
ncbi:ribosome maturation factor [Taibaiella lutea]|uniref:Ribosome maturation factor RimP n=1 Tax=Taibaiella lutea TaxID=2608001 RepID=A0A5M6CG87_9BACT|nr:ribosome maturation factor [Taibaiella lutea]KAA5533450.1 ribosome maturation factor [Taibaiella lutea]